MKALITGAEGQLGWDLQKTRPQDWEIIALNRDQLDITDGSAVRNALQQHRPHLVINTAAYTAVDKAESEKDKAYDVNASGAANIAKEAEDSGARLIHISTDFVFNGSNSQPYLPGDKPDPVNVYGASKLQGEQDAISLTKGKAVILRTSWVYSIHGKNFVKTMLRLMTDKDEISVVSDQVGTPTWAKVLAQAIWQIAGKKEIQGIWHWTNDGVASWYDFAAAIKEEAFEIGLLKKTIPIISIRTEDYPTPAKRPLFSVLDSTTTWKALGYTAPHWRKSLRMMLTELISEK